MSYYYNIFVIIFYIILYCGSYRNWWASEII